MTATSQLDIPMLDDLVKEAYDILSDGEVTFGEIVRLGGSLAGKASRFAHLSGHQKQTLVIRVVEVALEKVLKEKTTSLPEDQRAGFVEKIQRAAQFAKETLPSVLDVAVSAAKGKLEISSVMNKKTCWTAIKLLLRCAGVQVPVLPSPVMDFLEGPKEVSVASIELVAKEEDEKEVEQKVVEVVQEAEQPAEQVATETTLTPPQDESEPKSEETVESTSA
jgi:hypothetical protein